MYGLIMMMKMEDLEKFEHVCIEGRRAQDIRGKEEEWKRSEREHAPYLLYPKQSPREIEHTCEATQRTLDTDSNAKRESFHTTILLRRSYYHLRRWLWLEM